MVVRCQRVNPLNPELNPICHLLALFGAHHILHVSRIRVNIILLSIISFFRFHCFCCFCSPCSSSSSHPFFLLLWRHLHFTFRTQRLSGFLCSNGRTRFEPRRNAEQLRYVGVLSNTDVLPGLQVLATTLQWMHRHSYARACSATARMRRKRKLPEVPCFHFFVVLKYTWYQVR